MKAVLLETLRSLAPETPLRLSVMDTDYFAKPPLETEGHGEYAILPHNDTVTKDLWVATGELSCLFGCESIPSREMYRHHGVHLDQVAAASPERKQRFLDRVTEAWGWRGLVHTGSRRTLAGEIPLSGVLPTLLEQLKWGFTETANALEDAPAREQAHGVAEGWLQSVRDYAEAHPDHSLTDLYQFLLPRLVAALDGSDPSAVSSQLEIGGSMEQFRFNRTTAESPTFELLDLFLRPETHELACEAYNDAVRGSDIYTLDRFAPGAIPFDLVVPGLGRGTIRIIPERVIVELEKRVYLRISEPIRSVYDLAAVVEDQLGKRISLVGKALTLIAMLARTAVVVLNETGSTYVWRTRNMMQNLCKRGIAFELYPILRLQYPTWSTLGITGRDLRLPDHLAESFGAAPLTSAEFSQRWRSVTEEQRAMLEEATAALGPREVMDFLCRRGSEEWERCHREFDAHQRTLLELREQLATIKAAVLQRLGDVKRLKAQCNALQREKGEDFRRTARPLRERLWELGVKDLSQPLEAGGLSPEAQEVLHQLSAETERRQEFDERWEELRGQIHALQQQMRALERERVALLQDERILQARQRLNELQLQAQAAKLDVVRNAFLTVEGLEHTDYRPAAWWLLLLSPEGRWFREIRAQTQAYLEPLSCRPPQGQRAEGRRQKAEGPIPSERVDDPENSKNLRHQDADR
jgi:hypothetical protein